MKMNVRFLCESAVIAALYAVLTWVLAPISYGPIQFRISEILVLLVFFNPKYIYAIILGCFVANTTSSLGWYDMVFGTVATTLAVLPMIKTKRIGLAALFPVISNAVIISLELWLAFKEPGVLFYNMITIAIGEAVVLFGLGIPFYIGLSSNNMICELLEIDGSKIKKNNKFGLDKCLSILFSMLYVIFYFALPINGNITLFSLTKEQLGLFLIPVVSVIMLILSLFLKGKLRMILNYVLLGVIIFLWVDAGIVAHFLTKDMPGVYYFLYLLVIIINIVGILWSYKKEVTDNGTFEC